MNMITEQPAAAPPRTDEHAVVVDNAEFRYGANVVLRQATAVIPRGAVTVLIGPNGAGKSTLLNGIAGLISPASGSITINPLTGRTRQVSYVPQSTRVNEALPVTVRQVVMMGRYAGRGLFQPMSGRDRAATAEAMERTGITHLAKRPFSRLSGGERHRVLLAQGLVQDYDILLLDEPGTGLDLVSANAIRQAVQEEHDRGSTVVITTHHLGEAREADHVILLAGRVVAAGPPEQTLTVDNLVEAYDTDLLAVDTGHLLVDDPHHHPADPHHAHERSIHVESDQSHLHRPSDDTGG